MLILLLLRPQGAVLWTGGAFSPSNKVSFCGTLFDELKINNLPDVNVLCLIIQYSTEFVKY